MPSSTIWPSPMLTRFRLDSPLVTSAPLFGSSAVRAVEWSSVAPSPEADDSEREGVNCCGAAPGTDGTVTDGTVATPPTVTVGVVTVGTVPIGGVAFGGAGGFRPSGTSHFAFHASRARSRRRSNPFGSASLPDPVGPLKPLDAAEASAVALNSPASAVAYGLPCSPYVALPEFPGQRASAYWGCWKFPAAAVCPMGPVSAGLAVPSANGALSTWVCAIE